jgi:hypothetical protein
VPAGFVGPFWRYSCSVQMISDAHRLVRGARALTTRPVGVNPGGSGKLDDLGFEAGFELRSSTHLGGGGGNEALLDAIVDMVDVWKVKSGGGSGGGGGGCCNDKVVGALKFGALLLSCSPQHQPRPFTSKVAFLSPFTFPSSTNLYRSREPTAMIQSS